MRKLVSVRTISALSPIPNADAIEVASIDGWKVVVKKGEFSEGDLCAYYEIDSFLPESDSRYAFLMKAGVREFNGVRGHRLCTVKLRGQISQGLALPLHLFYQDFVGSKFDEGQELMEFFAVGEDLTELLGIQKWEPPIPVEMAGLMKGPFPGFIVRTDQERAQNLVTEIFQEHSDTRYEVTIKLDGTSFTAYHLDGELGVCSRNIELKIEEANADNLYVKMLRETWLDQALPRVGNYAVQGEIMGPGIQKNSEGLKYPMLFIFDVQNLDERRFLGPVERMNFVLRLQSLVNPANVTHVPQLRLGVTLADMKITSLEDLLNYADGASLNAAIREGLVFKSMDGKFSFKAINNRWLLNGGD